MSMYESLRVEYGPVPDEPFQAAAWWHEVLDEQHGDKAVSQAHQIWLESDASHARAWQAMESSWLEVGVVTSVKGTTGHRSGGSPTDAWIGRSRQAAIGLLAACLVVAVIAGSRLFVFDRADSYPDTASGVVQGAFQTAIGQRSQVVLEDGSEVHLNTATRLAVQIDQATRQVNLVEGQALFRVAHDHLRPFRVTVGENRITALGTSFDIRVDSDAQRMQVTMIEGRARVDWSGQQLELGAGEQFLLSPMEAQYRRFVDADQVVSWRDGRLIFEDASLAEAVAEINRYISRPIVLGDSDLGALPISGVFSTGRGELFAEAIEALHQLNVDLTNSERILVRKK